jgi:molybdate transport system substrate-binding protein
MKAFLFFYLVLLSTLAPQHADAQGSPIRIAAASDMKFALDSIVNIFQRIANAKVQVTYGSSGKLSEQISNGAPFDIFFSADIAYAESLATNGFAIGEPELYATGRIVLWSKIVDPSAPELRGLLSPWVKHIAIANPQHAPYGQRAVEAMRYYQVYDKVKGKLVYGENISQASQYLYSGAAEIGIIALSLAKSPPMLKQGGRYYLIPAEAHHSLKQAFVMLKPSAANGDATIFKDFLRTSNSKAILAHYGFMVEEEKPNR